VAGQRRCTWPSTLHHRVVRNRHLTSRCGQLSAAAMRPVRTSQWNHSAAPRVVSRVCTSAAIKANATTVEKAGTERRDQSPLPGALSRGIGIPSERTESRSGMRDTFSLTQAW
jgi:hypothetical protein